MDLQKRRSRLESARLLQGHAFSLVLRALKAYFLLSDSLSEHTCAADHVPVLAS